MANLPPLVAELIAKTDSFQAGLTQATQSARAASGEISGSLGKINAAFAALGVGSAVAGLAAMIKHSIDFQDELYKMSQRVGVTVESLSTLRYGAELSGLSLEDFEGGLAKLSKKLAEAGAGSLEAAGFFKQFGINASEIKNGTVDAAEAVKRMSDRFATAPDGINKTAASAEAFGKSVGGKFVPYLNQGREAIEGLESEARKLGLQLSTESAKRAEEFNDQMAVLKFASAGAAQSVAESLLPSLVKITQAMRDATVEGGKFAGLVAAVSTYKYGNDQDKNDADLVALTEKKMRLENDIAASVNANNSRLAGYLRSQLQAVNERLNTTMAYRKELEAAANIEKEAAKAREKAKTGGAQLQLPKLPENRPVKDRTSEDERIARLQAEGEEQVQKDRAEAVDIYMKRWRDANKEIEDGWKKQQEQVNEFTDSERDREDAVERQVAAYKAEKTEVKELTNFAREMGLTFSSAFEDAVVGGKKFQDVVQGLIADLARIVTRKTITEPLGDAVSGLFKDMLPGSAQQLSGPTGGGFWDSLTSWLPKFATGTPYVPQDMVAMVHKGERIIPAAENRAGGGGVTIVQHINIDSRSDQASIRQAMLVAKEEAKAEIMDSRMRGGAFA